MGAHWLIIGQIVTGKDGIPLDGSGNQLSKSAYQPPAEVSKFLARVQQDYQVSWALQNRSFDEFDGLSLLSRTRADQQLFAAYVGCDWVPQQSRWRWRGRKNTARNKIMGVLAHIIAGMLFPYVHAQNEHDEPDKTTAQVMRILVEEYLRKAEYEIKFMFMACAALVNPAVFVEVNYIIAMQRVKQNLANGKIKIVEAVDQILSGLNINVLQIDELLLPDFYSGTGNLQALPNLIRVRRISYDAARSIYAGKYYQDGKDLFDYVQAGRTRVVISGTSNQTLFDVDWTEADGNYVQILTVQYRPEDLEVDIVGGVGMFEYDNLYNKNPFKHRRMSLIGDEYISVPIYPYVMSGFEPIDPAGRFAYFKSAAFKEYWDDLGSNQMDRLLMDGTALDVFKPQFLSGVAKSDSTVMAPGATVFMPTGAKAEMYAMGPNLVAAINALREREKNMSESTVDPVLTGQLQKGNTAYAVNRAEQNARIFLGIFGLFVANLVRGVGELVMDVTISHTTVGELDASIPEALRMKYKTVLAKGKENGKDITNRIEMTDEYMGRSMSEEQRQTLEWELFNKAGGVDSDQRIYKVNPYKFARTQFSMWVDADKIVMRSTGTDQQRQLLAFQMMTDPRVAPFTDQKNVVQDFVVEPFSDGDPDRYMKKDMGQSDMLNSMMLPGVQPGMVPPPITGGAQSDLVVPPVPSQFG